MSRNLFLAIAAALCLGGCANLSTINRRSDLPKSGIAIHLDAAQRVVYSNSDGVLCAEPTPDALQSLAASTGGGLSLPSQGALSFSNAFAANAASIGLHTQSITLMRDQLYRICEQSYNKHLSNFDVAILLERSQNLTLGVLAIEQLTGVVAARQAALSGEASSSGSANIANTQAQLDRTTQTEANKKAAVAKVTDAQTAAQATLKTSADALDAASKATPAPAQADIDKLTAQKASDQKASDAADTELKTAQGDYTTAQAATEAIRNNLNAAITASNAAAKGTGGIAADAASRNNIHKDTVVAIAAATTAIVTKIVDRGYLIDQCLNVITATINGKTAGMDLKAVNLLCTQAIKTYIKNNAGESTTPFDVKVSPPIFQLEP